MLLGYALGSTSFTTGANNTYGYTAINNNQRQSAFTSGTLNPFVSFQIEDGKVTTNGSFVRTAQGCVIDSFTLSAAQGELVNAEIGYRAQSVIDSTNGPSVVTPIGSRVYLWKDVIVQIPGGTTLESVKEFSLEVVNNFETPHYLNGSDVIGIPIPLNRDITCSVTADLQTENLSLYNNYWKSGTEFISVIDLNANPGLLTAIGSMHTIITMSGCRVTSAPIPSNIEGINEITLEFKAGSISATEYNKWQKMLPW